MIVVDASALIAVLWSEPEAPAFERRIVEASSALISAGSRLEAYIVGVRRKGLDEGLAVERLIAGLGLVTIPVDELQLGFARTAFETYRGGRNGLNFGDCFSYALAKSRDLPLLFKGDDFRTTDVVAAL